MTRECSLLPKTEALIISTSDPASSVEVTAGLAAIDSELHQNKNLPLDDKKALLSAKGSLLLLQATYVRQDFLRQAEDTLRSVVTLDPTDPITLVALADYYQYESKRFDQALLWLERATTVADDKKEFVRLSYGQLCRLALQMQRTDLVEKSLTKLVEIGRSRFVTDIAPERELLDRIPPGTVSPSLLEQYRSLFLHSDTEKECKA